MVCGIKGPVLIGNERNTCSFGGLIINQGIAHIKSTLRGYAKETQYLQETFRVGLGSTNVRGGNNNVKIVFQAVPMKYL